jgi:hypothetical protein
MSSSATPYHCVSCLAALSSIWNDMEKWKKIRLELARTAGFPSGSVSRGYLIQLPLDGEGRIDSKLFALKPHRATVRRYWSTEPDEAGVILASEGGWTMRCNGGLDRMLLFGGQPILLGEQVSVLESDGGVLPFTVASIR